MFNIVEEQDLKVQMGHIKFVALTMKSSVMHAIMSRPSYIRHLRGARSEGQLRHSILVVSTISTESSLM